MPRAQLAYRLLLCTAFFVLLQVLPHVATAQQSGKCSGTVQCKSGCCSKLGNCGFGPEYCGDGCQNNCDATAECGQYAKSGQHDCPINVCCSQYGFCGTTEEFCGNGCQTNSHGSGCGSVSRKTCAVETDPMQYQRRIGYLNADNLRAACQGYGLESMPLGAWTHVNVAFLNFNNKFRLDFASPGAPNVLDLIQLANLKRNYPQLRVVIAVGGWVFSDPPTSALWSNMASSPESRSVFISSVLDVIQAYSLDGVDLDWEYPGAADRGGTSKDAANFVSLVKEMRDAFDVVDRAYTITATIPTSYWYLRGFDLKGMQEHVSWFNLMAYDLHGTWDHDNRFTGPYLRGHTDISEIQVGLDILRRNGIDLSNVVMGMAFYGRSFTMSDPNCHEPNGVCEFSRGGRPGSCSKTAGILTYAEIASRNNSLDVVTYYNQSTTVKYNVYESDQWISYDDTQSWGDKMKFLSENCFSGLMVWSIDQDNNEFDALYGLLGDVSDRELQGGHQSPEEQQAIADEFSAYTGQDCYVTEKCTDGSSNQQGPGQVCGDGFQSIETAHDPWQTVGHKYDGLCKKGSFRHICCPRKHLPHHCKWITKKDPSFTDDGCPQGQFQLNSDHYKDAAGTSAYFFSRRSLCCDSSPVLTACQWHLSKSGPDQKPCPDGWEAQGDGVRIANSIYCSGPADLSSVKCQFGTFCCPKGRGFSKCGWGVEKTSDAQLTCLPQHCPAGQIEVTSSSNPTFLSVDGSSGCLAYGLRGSQDPRYALCCNPPVRYNRDWPVDPERLFKIYYNDPNHSDVVWSYSNEPPNNNHPKDSGDYGDNAYGFVMLDGPEGSIDNTFPATFTVVRQTEQKPPSKRSYLTRNQTHLDAVFDHSEEILQIYCNFPVGSSECDRLWIDGAQDTIIRLPSHVGEGPFARVVYIEALHSHAKRDLPDHHIQHRSEQKLDGPIYQVKIDYAFHEIVAKDESKPVMMRVDFTNLHGYWDEMTAAEPGANRRRDNQDIYDWHSRVKRAAAMHESIRESSGAVNFSVPMEPLEADDAICDAAQSSWLQSRSIHKRWWGVFLDWIKRLTTVTKTEVGDLDFNWASTIPLFRAKAGCPGKTFFAEIKADLQGNFEMDAKYAYYLSGTFIPPSTPDVYAYFSIDPHAYIGIKVIGNAQAQVKSRKRKLIDTLSYPGLAVKGIAAVGPTLDVYGQIIGKVTLQGQVQAGARVNFGRTEVFWPQNDDASKKFENLTDVSLNSDIPKDAGVEPTFQAGVRADASLDIIMQPKANIGIKIGGGKLVAGNTIMDAKLSAFMTGRLSFSANASSKLVDNKIPIDYGAYVFYNIGYSAKAQILGLINWALGDRLAYSPDRQIEIYKDTYLIDLKPSGKRTIDETRGLKADGFSVNNSTMLVPSLIARDDSDPDDSDSNAPFNTVPQCISGGSGIRLPELRYNCPALGPTQINSVDPYAFPVQIPGACDAWNQLDPLPNPLTFSQNRGAKKDRRTEQCPSSTCTAIQERYRRATNLNYLVVSCDETPPASAEEGGHFEDRYSRSTLCITQAQNSGWVGQCQSLVRNLITNWGAIEPSPPSTGRVDRWVKWTDLAWEKQESGPIENRQRLTEYPSPMPLPDGITTRKSPMTSFVFRRNYTWSLNQNPTDPNSWWGATSRRFLNPAYDNIPDTPTGWDGVLCALNTFGQDDVYRRDKSDWNAVCFRERLPRWHRTPNTRRVGQCFVNFGPSNTNTKHKNDSDLDQH